VSMAPHRAKYQMKTRIELTKISGSHSVLGELTPAERRVAALIGAAKTNREVADGLSVSVRTVETHLSRIFQKLGVRSRTELALMMYGWARKASGISDPSAPLAISDDASQRSG